MPTHMQRKTNIGKGHANEHPPMAHATSMKPYCCNISETNERNNIKSNLWLRGVSFYYLNPVGCSQVNLIQPLGLWNAQWKLLGSLRSCTAARQSETHQLQIDPGVRSPLSLCATFLGGFGTSSNTHQQKHAKNMKSRSCNIGPASPIVGDTLVQMEKGAKQS